MTNKCYRQKLIVIMWVHQLDTNVHYLTMCCHCILDWDMLFLRLSRVAGTTSWSSVQSGETLDWPKVYLLFYLFTVLMINFILVRSCVFLGLRYKSYCSNIVRTMFVQPVKGICEWCCSKWSDSAHMSVWLTRPCSFTFIFGWRKLPNYKG